MKIIVTGGRHYRDAAAVEAELDRLLDRLFPTETLTVVHGACPTGADRRAARWARRHIRQGAPVVEDPHPADWNGPCRSPKCKPGHRKLDTRGREYCPLAGPYRNEQMAQTGADLCLAFPGGTGTGGMVELADAAGIPVRHIEKETSQWPS